MGLFYCTKSTVHLFFLISNMSDTQLQRLVRKAKGLIGSAQQAHLDAFRDMILDGYILNQLQINWLIELDQHVTELHEQRGIQLSML